LALLNNILVNLQMNTIIKSTSYHSLDSSLPQPQIPESLNL